MDVFTAKTALSFFKGDTATHYSGSTALPLSLRRKHRNPGSAAGQLGPLAKHGRRTLHNLKKTHGPPPMITSRLTMGLKTPPQVGVRGVLSLPEPSIKKQILRKDDVIQHVP